jgi:hypothetical protein
MAQAMGGERIKAAHLAQAKGSLDKRKGRGGPMGVLEHLVL